MTTTTMALTPACLDFVRERHLATLATLRADGSPHVVAVGFTWDADAGLARVITDAKSVKARNVARSGYAAVSQVDGARWLTLEGPAAVLDDPAAVTDAEDRYRRRYRQPRPNPTRVALVITVTRVLGSKSLLGRA
jgi:PPOX class probable F420-dependent enzyme